MDGGGQDYVVGLLEGRFRYPDQKISWLVENGVHKHFRTRREAEKVARHLREDYEAPTPPQPIHVRFHRPVGATLEEKQTEMRKRAEILGDPDLTIAEISAKRRKSTDWVIRKFRDEPGVIRDGSARRQILTVPVNVYNRVFARMAVK
jgi:hypothetical protein